MHHEWTAPIGIVSIYCHPVEFFLSQIGEFIARVNNSLLWSRMFKPKFTDLLYVYVHVNNSKHILDVENSFTCQSPNYILFCRFWQTVKPKNASWCKLHLQPVSADIYVYLDREDIFLHIFVCFRRPPTHRNYCVEMSFGDCFFLVLHRHFANDDLPQRLSLPTFPFTGGAWLPSSQIQPKLRWDIQSLYSLYYIEMIYTVTDGSTIT